MKPVFFDVVHDAPVDSSVSGPFEGRKPPAPSTAITGIAAPQPAIVAEPKGMLQGLLARLTGDKRRREQWNDDDPPRVMRDPLADRHINTTPGHMLGAGARPHVLKIPGR